MSATFDLETAVLEILYQKCLERPLWVTESEVFWSIPNTSITEREVREMLEQLVYHRRILKQVGKYQISKTEFLSIKERLEGLNERREEEQVTVRDLMQKSETETQKVTRRNWHLRKIIVALFLLSVGLLLGLSLHSLIYSSHPKATLPNIPTHRIQIEQTLPTLSAKSSIDLSWSLRSLSLYLKNEQEASKGRHKRVDCLQNYITELQDYLMAQEYRDEMVKEQHALVTIISAVVCLCLLFMIAGMNFSKKNLLMFGELKNKFLHLLMI